MIELLQNILDSQQGLEAKTAACVDGMHAERAALVASKPQTQDHRI